MLAGLAHLYVPRGRWFPAPLTTGMLRLIALALAYQAAVRGVDYSVGNDTSSASVSSFEKVFPLHVWGVAFMVGAGLLVTGILFSRQHPAWLGHSVLGTLYGAVGVGLLFQSLDAPFFDGVRTGSGLLIAFLLHTVLGWVAAPGWTLRWRGARDTTNA